MSLRPCQIIPLIIQASNALALFASGMSLERYGLCLPCTVLPQDRQTTALAPPPRSAKVGGLLGLPLTSTSGQLGPHSTQHVFTQACGLIAAIEKKRPSDLTRAGSIGKGTGERRDKREHPWLLRNLSVSLSALHASSTASRRPRRSKSCLRLCFCLLPWSAPQCSCCPALCSRPANVQHHHTHTQSSCRATIA